MTAAAVPDTGVDDDEDACRRNDAGRESVDLSPDDSRAVLRESGVVAENRETLDTFQEFAS